MNTKENALIQKHRWNSGDISFYLAKYGIYIAFVLMILVMTLLSPTFMSPVNMINIVKQVSIIGIIAVGATLVLLVGGIDLSPGSIAALSGVVAASLGHPDEYPILVPIIAALLVGAFCGLINGTIVSKGKVPPFIVTLGMLTAARGAALVYSDGRPINNLSETYNYIGGGYILGIPVLIYIFAFIFLIVLFMLHNSRFGRHIYAVGGNELAARVSGLNTDRIKTVVYVMAGALAGLAGLLLSSRIVSGSPVAGSGYELDAIAAAVIGGTSTSGGIGRIYGTVVGVLIIGVMNNGLDLLNVSSYYQQILKGTIVVLAVFLDRKNQRT